MSELLNNSNILNLLQKEGCMEAGLIAIDPLLEQKMQVIGFVPCRMDLAITTTALDFLDMNTEIIVNPFCMRCKNSKQTLPIMTHIKSVENSIYEVGDLCYVVSEKGIYNLQGKKYTTFIYLTESFCKYNDDANSYKTENPLFEFSRQIGKYKVISEMFMCLCRYINPVTGIQNFMLKFPQDIIKIKNTFNNG